MQGSASDARRPRVPPPGKLGILTPGLGAVATTFMAGVESIRRGTGAADRLAHADGDDPARQAHRQSHAADQGLRPARRPRRHRVRRVGSDSRTTRTPRRKKAGVLEDKHLEPITDFLAAIKPMPAVFENKYVTRIDGTNVKKGKTKRDLAEQLRAGHPRLQGEEQVRPPRHRLVRARPRSSSSPARRTPTLEQFERAMDDNDEAIAPSMLYAYAAIMEGVPFCNGAPNLSVDIPALVQLANEQRRADLRQGLQDRPDLDEDRASRRGSRRACSASPAGTRRTSSATATARCSTIPASSRRRKSRSSSVLHTSCSRRSIPSCTRTSRTWCASTTTRRAATTRKAGTTSTSSGGWAIRCRSRSTSSAATRSSPRRSCSTSRCSATSRSAPA